MKRPSRRVSALGAAALAMAGSLTLAACSERSPEQSTIPYDPADGIVANLGSLAVRDLLVVSAGQGQPGVVSGALINTGTGDLTVTFSTSGGAAAPVTVPAGQVVRLGSGEGASNVQFQAVSTPPGSMLSVRVATPPTGPRVLDVPVLSPSLQYATITPTPTPTTSTPTEGATDAPTDTPSGTTTTS